MTTPSGRISNEPEEERKKEKRKNAIYSGHLRLCQQPREAHALRSDQNIEVLSEYPIFVSLFLLQLCQIQYNAKTKHNKKIITSSCF